MLTISTNIEYRALECGGCGIVFYVPAEYLKEKEDENGDFHCPNGCSRQFYSEKKKPKPVRQSKG